MNVVFISTKPANLTSGSEVRNYYLLDALVNSPKVRKITTIYISVEKDKKFGYSTRSPKYSLYTFPLRKRKLSKSILAYMRGRIPYTEYFKDHNYDAEIKKLISDANIIFLSELDSFIATEKIFSNFKHSAKIVLDCHNVDYLRFKFEIQAGNLIKKKLGSILSEKLKKLEIKAIKNVNHVLTCSDIDKNYFSSYISGTKITVIPNGVKLRELKNSYNNKTNLVFMGLLSYPPNEDALKYYFKSIHPSITASVPQSKITIIGKNAPYWLRTLAIKEKNVELTGFVDDPHSFLLQATACICPIRFGSGTRLKILEYMAAGKVVISTPIGCEGINVKDKESILIAKDTSSFIKIITQVLREPEKVKKIGVNAYKLVQQDYDWKKLGSQLVNILSSLNSQKAISKT